MAVELGDLVHDGVDVERVPVDVRVDGGACSDTCGVVVLCHDLHEEVLADGGEGGVVRAVGFRAAPDDEAPVLLPDGQAVAAAGVGESGGGVAVAEATPADFPALFHGQPALLGHG